LHAFGKKKEGEGKKKKWMQGVTRSLIQSFSLLLTPFYDLGWAKYDCNVQLEKKERKQASNEMKGMMQLNN